MFFKKKSEFASEPYEKGARAEDPSAGIFLNLEADLNLFESLNNFSAFFPFSLIKALD